MNALLRLGAFLVVLVVVFGAAALLGDAVGPLERGAAADPAQGEAAAHGEDGGHRGDDDRASDARGGAEPAGLGIAAGDLRLVADDTTLAAGEAQRFSFRIVGGDGRPVRRFDETHEREMHLIVVSRDLADFQHLHPELGADGRWSTVLRLPAPGAYRAFADFSSDGRPTVLGVDLAVPGEHRPRPQPRPARHARVDGYGVWLHAHLPGAAQPSRLAFPVFRDGEPVEPEPYLGARGHLVVLREGDLAFLHTHPHGDETEFETEFPSPGRYRAFFQFAHDGRVHTAAFTIEVPQ